MAVFHRLALADQLVGKLLEPSPTSASPSGLFLAAPRRTGKSTFLREDLRPSLEARGALVIFADLWADREADPGDVIVNAVRESLQRREGIVARMARASGTEKATVGGLAFSLDRVGLGKGVSLATALSALSDETKQLIVLLVDEAQHAITSAAGNNALFALKAARDEVNSSAHHGLRIVATGSNRDKLAMLRNSREQAFFGAPLINFPTLGPDYVAWFVAQLPYRDELDSNHVFEWFAAAAHRPEMLQAAADTLHYDLEAHAGTRARRFEALVREQVQASNDEALRVVHSLTSLQAAVLRVLARSAEAYAPFEAATLAKYAETLARIDPNSPIQPDANNVNQALMALQEKGLVWKAARGVYALEDPSLAGLMEQAGLL